MLNSRLVLSASMIVLAAAAVGTGCGSDNSNPGGGRGYVNYLDGGRDAGSALDAGFVWADAGTGIGTWVFELADAGADAGLDGGCEMTMCLTGAPTRGGSNDEFDRICENPIVPNVLRSCDDLGGLSCYSTFNTFGVESSLYPALFRALDRNGDNAVNAADNACQVNLLGFSWGGIEAIDVAKALAGDARVDPAYRSVKRLFVMDPYQPQYTLPLQKLVIPTNVTKFVSFRHTTAPSNDCSNGATGGPYKGIAPRCILQQSCADYDYSASPNTAFPTANGGAMWGYEVDHCHVPTVAEPAILADFRGQTYSQMPTQVPVSVP